MARVEVVPPEESSPRFVLTLSAAEAQYVEDALFNSTPKHFGNDDTWDALSEALREAGIYSDRSASGR